MQLASLMAQALRRLIFKAMIISQLILMATFILKPNPSFWNQVQILTFQAPEEIYLTSPSTVIAGGIQYVC